MENKVVRLGATALAERDKSRSYEDHERTVRTVLAAIETDMVLRCLYNAVVTELTEARQYLPADWRRKHRDSLSVNSDQETP